MAQDWMRSFCYALAEEIKERFPKAIVYTTMLFGEYCVEITLDLQQYQVVFDDGSLKIVRYHKAGQDITKPPTERVYRDIIKSYDMISPTADFEPLMADLDKCLNEDLDGC